MVKKVQNFPSWFKNNYTFDYNLGAHAKNIVFIIIWVMFGLNINIQSQKLHLKYSFHI